MADDNEYYRKLNQQLVQKDNLIKLLQLQIKKQQEGDPLESSRVRELEGELAHLREEVSRRERALQDRESEVATLASKKSEFEVRDRERELLSREKSDLAMELDKFRRDYDTLARELAELRMARATEGTADPRETDKLRVESERLTRELREVSLDLEKSRSELRDRERESEDYRFRYEREREETRRLTNLILEEQEKSRKILATQPSRAEIEEFARRLADRDREIAELRSTNLRTETIVKENDTLRLRIEKLESELAARVSTGESVFAGEDPGTISRMLTVADELQDAFAALDTGDFSEFKNRVTKQRETVRGLFRSLGINPVATIGEKFDANLHEVVEYARSKEHEDNVVIDEVRKGYVQNDRVIRRAQVKVIKNRAKCVTCGNVSRVGSAYCDGCGAKLETAAIPYRDLKNTGEMFFQTGRVFEEKGLFEKAREYYQQAVALEPMNGTCLYALGRSLDALGLYDDALTVFRKVSDSDARLDEVRRAERNTQIKRNILEGLRNLVIS